MQLSTQDTPRVAAVSYLNTVPLVWGLLQGPQRGKATLEFCLPSVCAHRLENGEADIGLLPVVEMVRQGLELCHGTGIACHGAVRSILLVTKRAPGEIDTLAVDSGSRTSVLLARVILKRIYGAEPRLLAMPPDLNTMLEAADAALIIGDPALAIEPEKLPYLALDLGLEWRRLTDLPMVFAAWSGGPRFTGPSMAALLADSLAFGEQDLERIIREQSAERGISPPLVSRYLREHIRFHLGENEMEGLRMFLQYASEFEPRLILEPSL